MCSKEEKIASSWKILAHLNQTEAIAAEKSEDKARVAAPGD